MDIGFSGFRKVIELGMMSRWPIHRSDGGAYGTRTRSPVFAPNPRCAVSSVIRRCASSRSPGAQKNGLRVLRANSFGLVRPAQGRGRGATAPWEIPWRGWKEVLSRTYDETLNDRLFY